MKIKVREGIREVPNGWEMRRFKFLFELQDRPPRPDDGVLTAYRDGQVTLRSVRRAEGYTEAIKEYGYQGVRRGDLVISSMDAFAGAIGVAEADGKASPVYHVHRARQGVDARYFAYLLRDLAQRGLILSLARGIRERSTAFDAATCRSLELPVPPTAVQRTIADFLDRETAHIDRLISRKGTLETLIGERTRSWAAEAACRGLLRAPLRDSGVQGLGPCPAHWRVTVLRRLPCDVQTGPFGSQLHADDYVSDGIPIVNPANLVDGLIVSNRAVTVTNDTARRLKRHVLRRGDIVFGRRGQLGRAALVSEREQGWLCGTGCLRVRFKTNAFEPSYLHRFLRLPAIRQYLESVAVGSTMENLSSGVLLSMPLLMPPQEEQVQIAAAIESYEERSSHLVGRLMRQQELLKEHRHVLITGTVSGHIDVSNAAA